MEEKGKFMKTFLAQFGLMIIPISRQTPYFDIVDTDLVIMDMVDRNIVDMDMETRQG